MKTFYAIIGVICIIAAVLCLVYIDTDVYISNSVSKETYGGDAYTGIQNAAAATANKIDTTNRTLVQLLEAIQMIGCLGFLITGLFAFAKAAKVNNENKSKNDNEINNQSEFYGNTQNDDTQYQDQYNYQQPRTQVNYSCYSITPTGKHSSGLCFACLNKYSHVEICKIKDHMGTREWPVCDYCKVQYNQNIQPK